MLIEEIIKNGNRIGIDIIAILEGGRYCAQSFSNYVRSINSSSVYYYEIFPKCRSGADISFVSESARRMQPKSPDKYLKIAKKESLVPDDLTLEEFNKSPEIRLKGKPTPDHLAFLVDDYVFKGKTANACIKDLSDLGYKKENIFVVSWDISNPFLYDSDLKIIQGIPIVLIIQ